MSLPLLEPADALRVILGECVPLPAQTCRSVGAVGRVLRHGVTSACALPPFDNSAVDGYAVRIYVPFGTDWYGYFMRRLAERPANVGFVLRSMVKS